MEFKGTEYHSDKDIKIMDEKNSNKGAIKLKDVKNKFEILNSETNIKEANNGDGL